MNILHFLCLCQLLDVNACYPFSFCSSRSSGVMLLGKNTPFFLQVIIVFVDCMLGLENDEIGEFLGGALLAKVVDLLTDLDVCTEVAS